MTNAERELLLELSKELLLPFEEREGGKIYELVRKLDPEFKSPLYDPEMVAQSNKKHEIFLEETRRKNKRINRYIFVPAILITVILIAVLVSYPSWWN